MSFIFIARLKARALTAGQTSYRRRINLCKNSHVIKAIKFLCTNIWISKKRSAINSLFKATINTPRPYPPDSAHWPRLGLRWVRSLTNMATLFSSRAIAECVSRLFMLMGLPCKSCLALTGEESVCSREGGVTPDSIPLDKDVAVRDVAKCSGKALNYKR